MLERSTWKRPVREWLDIKPKPHRFEQAMINTFPHGVPIGGFGAGTIGVAPDGKWSSWHLDPGKPCFEPEMGAGFSFSYTVQGKTQRLSYRNAMYQALYPSASWEFTAGNQSKLLMHQYTPVIMNEYKLTSYPVGLFRIRMDNSEQIPLTFTVKFSLPDILGRTYQREIQDKNMRYRLGEPVGELVPALNDYGVKLQKEIEGTREEFGIFCSDVIDTKTLRKGKLAITSTYCLQPGETRDVWFVCVWNLPVIRFAGGQEWQRKYTEFFEPYEKVIETIARETLQNRDTIIEEIEKWQQTVWKKCRLNDEIMTLMINELYYLAHGGTMWEAGTNRFGYLECTDYPYYETLDVRYYSSWALLAGWPELEKQVMKQFADSITQEDSMVVNFGSGYLAHQSIAEKDQSHAGDHKVGFRKHFGACPHDLGTFEENPFDRSNAYCYQNPNYWKDLNPKFILMVYRDYYFTRDADFLRYCWPAVKEAHRYFIQFDTDGDELPENGGWPDQTYDNWTMQGTSAYCAILWLAALAAYREISIEVGEGDAGIAIRLSKGIASLDEKLWTGTYFRFDEKRDDIMADQLAGQWYLRLCNLPAVIRDEQETMVLNTIFKQNFTDFIGNRYGMVNGRTPENGDIHNKQGNDCWIGAIYGIASYYLKRGDTGKANSLLMALYKVLYNEGFYFRTPESFDEHGRYIAQMYMRPQAIWALSFV